MFSELERVALRTDLPTHGLSAGDVGTVVFVYPESSAIEVEFVTQGGDTVAVLTLDAADVRSIGPDEMPHVRPVSIG